jgi:hypothetical protein
MDFVLGMVEAEVVGLGHRQSQLLGYVVLARLLVSLRPFFDGKVLG